MSHCTSRCRSKRHIFTINAAIQNGSITQAQAYIATCHNAFKSFDINGRNLFHVAAAYGKYELLSWLLGKAKSSLATKDKESGWTALHRAIFYGQIACAVNLIKSGASLGTKDNESLTPIDLCVKDRMYMPFVQSNREIGEYNVYTWGDNSSYTLGHGKEARSASPELVETFRRKRITIKQVVMSRYHSVYLTSDGAVYTCGHGRGGRLGLGHEEPILLPYMVKLPQTLQPTPGSAGDASTELSMSTVRVEAIAAGWDHTLLLGANGRVYSFGNNEHKQLGISSDSFGMITEPKMVNAKALLKGPPVKYIAAGRFHSVMATDTTVYTMGLNVGQLGHPKTDRHVQPLPVTSVSSQTESRVQLIECSDACTVVVMSGERREGFYILYKYTTKFINFRGSKFDRRISRLCVSGGQLDQSVFSKSINEDGTSPLKVFWINQVGQLMLWADDVIKRVAYPSLGRQLSLFDVSCNPNEVLVTSEEGGAYVLTDSNKTVPIQKELSKLSPAVPTIDMKVRRIAGVHRATQCSLDPKSSNYALLYAKEYTCSFAEVGPSKMLENMESLLSTADEMDGICDIVIKCSGERIACHKFILAYQSTYFNKSLSLLSMSHSHTPFSQHREQIFPTSKVQELRVDEELNVLQFVLKHIYTGVSDESLIFVTGSQSSSPRNTKSKHRLSTDKANDQLVRVQEIGRKYGLGSLVKYKSGLCSPVSYMMSKLTQWCDVLLVSLDGKEIRCHKCVLVSRMEYFQTMLTGHWVEGKEELVRLELPIPYDILYSVMLYVYTDECIHLQGEDIDIEFMVNVMVVADQLLLCRLKEMCEKLIISQLTLDNVVQVYQLSITYQTEQLKDAAMFMICLNMAEMLELSILDDLDLESLQLLTGYYRDKLRCMSRRFLGGTSCGPNEDEMNVIVKEQEEESTQPKRTRRRTRTASASSIDSDVLNSTLEELKVDDGDFIEEFTDADSPSKANEVATAATLVIPTSLPTNGDRDVSFTASLVTKHSSATSSQDKLSPVGTGDVPLSLRDIMLQEQKSLAKPQHNQKLKGKHRYRSLDSQKSPTEETKTTLSPTTKPHIAWSVNTPVIAGLSLRDVMKNEESHLPTSKKESSAITSKSFKYKSKSSSTVKQSEQSSPIADKPPAWNIPTSPTHHRVGHSVKSVNRTKDLAADQKSPTSTAAGISSQQSPSFNFKEIINQEVMETIEYQRNIKKPLTTVQIEERAIEELRKRYENMKKPYERITVERVTHMTSLPVWKNS